MIERVRPRVFTGPKWFRATVDDGALIVSPGAVWKREREDGSRLPDGRRATATLDVGIGVSLIVVDGPQWDDIVGGYVVGVDEDRISLGWEPRQAKAGSVRVCRGVVKQRRAAPIDTSISNCVTEGEISRLRQARGKG